MIHRNITGEMRFGVDKVWLFLFNLLVLNIGVVPKYHHWFFQRIFFALSANFSASSFFPISSWKSAIFSNTLATSEWSLPSVFFINFQCSLEKRFCLSIFALVSINYRQIVHGLGNIRMAFTKSFFSYCQ